MRGGDEVPERKPPPREPPLIWKPPPPPPWKPPPPPPPPRNPPLPPPWNPPPPRCANAGIAVDANRIVMLIVNFENNDRDISRPPLELRKTYRRVRGANPFCPILNRFYTCAGGCMQANLLRVEPYWGNVLKAA